FLDGGGIYRDNPMTLTNVTISGNTSAQGEAGGGYNKGTPPRWLLQACPGTFINFTLGNNKALTPRGISPNNSKVPTVLKNSLLAQNIQTSDNTNANCNTTDTMLSSQNHNLSDDATCAGFFTQTGDFNLNGQTAGIGPLADNGGNFANPPFTHALFTGSKAIYAIPPTGCIDSVGTALTFRERHFSRAGLGLGPHCDIGAFELQVIPTPTPAPSATPTPSGPLQFLEGSGSGCGLSPSTVPHSLPILAGLLFAPVLLRGLLRKRFRGRFRME